jgi:hypothetical protein
MKGSGGSSNSKSKVAAAPSSTTREYPTQPTMKEYLVRFTAGMDERKTPYQHWIVLEEHGM